MNACEFCIRGRDLIVWVCKYEYVCECAGIYAVLVCECLSHI